MGLSLWLLTNSSWLTHYLQGVNMEGTKKENTTDSGKCGASTVTGPECLSDLPALTLDWDIQEDKILAHVWAS